MHATSLGLLAILELKAVARGLWWGGPEDGGRWCSAASRWHLAAHTQTRVLAPPLDPSCSFYTLGTGGGIQPVPMIVVVPILLKRTVT